jgi:hypothetical protein
MRRTKILGFIGSPPVRAGVLVCSLPGAARAADLASIVDDAAWGWSDLGVQLGLLVVAFLVLGAVVALLDLRRQRAEEANTLGLRVADSVSRHPVLRGLEISVAAHPSLWPSAPITVLVRGHVPGPGLRNLVHIVAERELARDPHDCRLDDRIEVDPRELMPAA